MDDGSVGPKFYLFIYYEEFASVIYGKITCTHVVPFWFIRWGSKEEVKDLLLMLAGYNNLTSQWQCSFWEAYEAQIDIVL